MKIIPPVIPHGLVEWLEAAHRDATLPTDVNVSHRELDMRIGQRSVIERVRQEFNRQQEDIRNPHNPIRRN